METVRVTGLNPRRGHIGKLMEVLPGPPPICIIFFPDGGIGSYFEGEIEKIPPEEIKKHQEVCNLCGGKGETWQGVVPNSDITFWRRCPKCQGSGFLEKEQK